MTDLCQLEGRTLNGSWPILGRKLAILVTFFKILATIDIFCC